MNIFSKIAQWIIISVLAVASLTPQPAIAQSEEATWAEPMNLSHSGAATNPTVLIDSAGTVHAVWQDEFANFVYARLEENQWSAPQPTNLHFLFGRTTTQERPTSSEGPGFTSTNPFFIAGSGQSIFAVWITEEGRLYSSRVPNHSFNDVEAWIGTHSISAFVTAFSAAVDVNGDLHITYIQTDEDDSEPAGIYYVRYGTNSRSWTDPDLLYASPYFRSLESSQANIRLTTGGTAEAPSVYVVWDNQQRKQVFLARSMDRGTNWEEAMQVAGPLPESGLDGPFNLRVGAYGNNIVLVWQSGQPASACTQYFQSSTDAGSTWSEAQLMLGDLPGCAQTNEFVTVPANNPGNVLFLLTRIQDQIILSAWDGFQWSVPQAQPLLSSFEDPEIFKQVEYDCHRAVLFGEQLYVVGCDRGGGGDIWITSSNMASTTSWFSPPVWGQPALVTSDSLDVGAVELIASEDNLLHAFFSQKENSSIYYTRWDGTAWSRIAPVLTVPDGYVSQPVIAVGPGDELFLLVRGSTGSLYFSRANSSEAIEPSSWSTLVQLPLAHEGKVSLADVAWDAGGTIYIAYSVPVNDDRGVYLIQSKDRGATWSEPLQVFDGVAADFAVVGSPTLQVSEDGLIYIMWRQEAIPTDGVALPLSLYFTRSEDSGNSFSEAERVVDAPVDWRKLMTDNQGNLHGFWQRLDTMKTLSDQVSMDAGHSWQAPEVFPTEGGIATVTADHEGRLHLVSVNHDRINYWLWDENRWQPGLPTRWSPVLQNNEPVEFVAASVNKNGEMVVVLVAPINSGDTPERQIFYITRTLSLPPNGNTMPDASDQSGLSPASAPITAPAESVLIAAASNSLESANPLSAVQNTSSNNPITLLAEVLLPLILLLIGVLIVVYLRSVWSRGS